MQKSKHAMFILIVVATTTIYGLGNVLMKIAYEGVSPMWCAALRFGLATVVFLLVFGRKVLPSLRRARLRAWLPSSLCMAATYLTCSLAVNMTSATNAGFFVALPMLFTPVLSLVVTGRKFGKGTVLLQGAVIAGLYLLCCNGGALTFGWGELLGLASELQRHTIGEMRKRGADARVVRGLGEVDAFAMSTAQIGCTFAVALIAALAFEPVPDFSAAPAASWAAIVFLGLVGTALAFFLQNLALSNIPSATVSVVLCTEPVFTAAISAVALGEVLEGMGIAGAVLIVACTMMASFAEERRPAPTSA